MHSVLKKSKTTTTTEDKLEVIANRGNEQGCKIMIILYSILMSYESGR